MPSKLVRRDKKYHNSYQNHIVFKNARNHKIEYFLSEKISFGGAFYAKALKYDIKMHLQILEESFRAPYWVFKTRPLNW